MAKHCRKFDTQEIRSGTFAPKGTRSFPLRLLIFVLVSFAIGRGAAAANGAEVPSRFVASLLSQKLGYAVSSGEPFYTVSCSPCVFPGAVIPQAAWSVPAQHLLQYIPLPNIGSDQFSEASLAQRLNDDKGSARVDANTR